jgi:hypothetical protein
MAAPFADFTYVIRGFDAAHKGLRTSAHSISIDAASGVAGPLQATCFDLNGSIVTSLSA